MVVSKNKIKQKAYSLQTSFASKIAQFQIENNFISCKDIYNNLLDSGIKAEISDSTFVKYCNYRMVPNYSIARKIFDQLNIKATEEELMDMLLISKSEHITNTISEYRYSGTVSIPYRHLNYNNLDEDMIQIQLNERIMNVGSGRFSNYVASLIRADLKKTYGLNEGEEK